MNSDFFCLFPSACGDLESIGACLGSGADAIFESVVDD
jgi:hypothetical protein